jgi:hypothetical protein
MSSFLRPALFAAVIVGLAPAAALAHRMEAVATADAAVLRVEVGYDDFTPSEGAEVTVTDAAGVVVASGTTDENGVCMFPRPPAGTYRVTVNDHAGHKTTLMLTLPESEAELISASTEKRNRWLMTAAGLGLIAVFTLALRRVTRK